MQPLSKMEAMERLSQEARAIRQQVQTLCSAAEKNLSQENAKETGWRGRERKQV